MLIDSGKRSIETNFDNKNMLQSVSPVSLLEAGLFRF